MIVRLPGLFGSTGEDFLLVRVAVLDMSNEDLVNHDVFLRRMVFSTTVLAYGGGAGLMRCGVPKATHMLNLLPRVVDGKSLTLPTIDAPRALPLVNTIVPFDGVGMGKLHIATSIGVHTLKHFQKRVRLCSIVELVKALESKKGRG